MLFLFIAVLSGDTLPGDTALVIEDTTALETLTTYEIPDIVTYDRTEINAQTRYLCFPSITPRLTDVTYSDAFFYSPYNSVDHSMGMPGYISFRDQDEKHTLIYLNNHPLNHPIYGTMNLRLLPIQFMESIDHGVDGYGNPVIMIDNKVNHYDRPYSTTGFMSGSFGHTAYIFELTRAIDDNFGFYLDGIYRKADSYRMHDQFTISSFYANLYDNHFIPMRLDALFCSHGFDFSNSLDDTISTAHQQLIDIGYTAGTNEHNGFLYFSHNTDAWHDSLQQRSIEQTTRTYGLGSDNCHEIGMFQFLYKIVGMRHEIKSDLYGSHTLHALQVNMTINTRYRRFIMSISNRGKVNSNDTFRYTPYGAAGYELFDSLILFTALSRQSRSPYLSETTPLVDTLYGSILTNDSLETEYYWSQELGVRKKYIALTLFRHEYENRIIPAFNSIGQMWYVNSEPWTSWGSDASIALPIELHSNTETNAYTHCSFGINGTYLFTKDTLFSIPGMMVKGNVEFSRQTRRFGLTLAAYSTYIGTRYTFDQPVFEPYTVFGLTGIIRFVNLSFAGRIDNIFNTENYYNSLTTPLAPRAFTINIQWQFWY